MSDFRNETPMPPEGAKAYPPNAGSTGTGTANTATVGTGAPSAGAQANIPQSDKGRKGEEHRTAQEQHKKGGAGGFWKSFASGAVGAVVILALVGALWSWTPLFDGMKGGSVSSSGGTITIDSSEDATIAQAVAAKTIDSVVTIYTYSDSSAWNRYFDSSSSSNSPSALGSGVIISEDGYILTNYHVVEDISKAVVKIGDKQYEATAVGADPETDLAVIKIDATGLTPMEWGDSSQVKVGEWVMAIGSPYGYENTVTTGIVSALYRSDVLSDSTGLGTTVYTDMIQTDAAINPGNSGGALVDGEGKLIGINTYISSTSQSSAGLGFAIPANEAKQIAEQLMEGKEVTHALFGITMMDAADAQGVEVASVYKDTGADKAGLHTGDVITKIDGSAVTNTNDVSVAVSSKAPGDKMSVTYQRDGKEQTTEVTLGSDSDQTTEYAENGKPETDPNSYGYGYGDTYGGSGDGGNYNLGDMFDQLFGGASSGSYGQQDQGGGSFWN